MKEELSGTETSQYMARLEELLALELSCCERLQQLSERQLKLCVTGRSNHLPGVLQERMKCLERLNELEATLVPVAEGLGNLGSREYAQAVDRIKSKVTRIDLVVKEVAALDAQCEAVLKAELGEAERALCELNRHSRVAERYASPLASSARVVVVSS